MAVLTYNGNIIGKSSANDGVLTIQKNNVTLDTFSANSSSNKTINIEVPTKLSDLTDDVISGNYIKTSNNNTQQITRTDSGGTVITLKSGTTAAWIQYLNSNDTSLGYIGVESNNKPSFYDSSSHEIALVENVIKTSDTAVQTITRNNAGSSIPLALKSGDTISAIRFLNSNGSFLGDIGVDENSRPYLNDGSKHPIPFSDDVIAKSSTSAQTIENTSTDSILPLVVQGDSTDNSIIQFRGKNGVTFGSIGAQTNTPIFRNTSGVNKEIALVENMVNRTYYGSQTIETTGTGGYPLTLKGGDASETTIRFMDKNSNILGYIGVATNDTPVFYGSSGSGQKAIALVDNVATRRIIIVDAGASVTVTNLPKAYLIACENPTYSAMIAIYIGSGYGADSTRHKIIPIIESSYFTFTPHNTLYRLIIQNNSDREADFVLTAIG